MSKRGSELFFEGIDRTLKKIRETQRDAIAEAARVIADCIVSEGVVHAYGAGHSHELAEDIFFRAGTLVPINNVHDAGTSGTTDVVKSSYTERLEGYGYAIFDHIRALPQDVFIVISNSGRNASGIELAQKAKENGHKVIALTSMGYSKNITSRHSSGKKLYEFADVVLDNCGELGDVCVHVDWMEQGLGPTSTVAGAYILHAVLVESAMTLHSEGHEPPVFLSGNFDKGMDFNEKYLEKYWHRIRAW
jgi:uncharacterized phosphosugar-binding protein